MIPEETIEQVRDSVDLVGLIGESVALKRTGSDYRGACPFHGGTNRNFAVIPKKGRYYCFVCHESGDVFSWFMKRHGMSYPDAVRETARRTGITIPERAERAGPDPHEPLYGAAAAAHDWFTRQLLELPEAKLAREYLENRGIPLETAGMLGLGFAPPGKTFLTAMSQLGIEPGILLRAGLSAQREDGEVIARFRGRLLFPIHDLRGRVVGFGGRLLGPGEPKYLNSPETEIFHKGRQLYNLHQAKGPIRKEESVLLVEGYFDVLQLVLAGVEHVVAPLGTALTPDQAALLRRYTPAATLLYDSDQAGLRATFRSGDELLRQSLRVRVATLPPGEDPDTLVRKGGVPALDAVLRDAVDLFERKIQLLERHGWFEGVEHRRDAVDRLLPTIRAAADPITRELYLSLAAGRAGVSKEVLEQELREGRAAGQRGSGAVIERPGTPSPAARPARARRSPESQLITALLAAPEWMLKAREELDPALFESPRLREVYEALLRRDAPSDQMPEGLSDGAGLAWSYLKEVAQDPDPRDAATLYDRAAQILRARPQYREMHALADPGDKQRKRSELRARFPAADAWYEYQKAARREARKAQRSRGA
ncbi:MAG TPA: DNA primase [Gemmatimonadales bacterium]|jgi:DNA primase|nr:DNA primase [Gemmatimonadales bacterium]